MGKSNFFRCILILSVFILSGTNALATMCIYDQTIPPTKTGHFLVFRERLKENISTISTGNKFCLVAFSMEMPQAKRNSSIAHFNESYRIITQEGLIST